LNEQEGHLFGDQTLQRVAKLIEQSVRETDIVARYGGEEFVVVMPHTGLTGACIFAERLRLLIEDELSLTISGGVAEAAHGDTHQSLLSRADSALYSAKANGRSCLFVHTGKLIRPYHADRSEPPRTPPGPAEEVAVTCGSPDEKVGG
jgi:diguanylate cyclase (GGDEF)-like protein